ncbi:MAG: hypothetical protein L0212_09955 [Acidobacteria bacterium]|nr:hypothetical protein [Acidobacteriota bacterium]
MSDHDHERELFTDKLLDAGLARYSQAEPRPGLEQRILAGLRAQPRPSFWLDWRWASALATVAVPLLVIVIFLMRQPSAPEMPPQTAVTLPSPVAPPPAPVPTPTAAAPHPNALATSRLDPRPEGRLGAGPRLGTFPAPAPLSEQERLLLLFMQQAPKEHLVARQLGAGPIERLQFQPLSFAPLEIQKPTTEN